MWIGLALASSMAAVAHAPESAAQLYTTPYFHVLDISAGLPASHVYKTVQDRDGYMWLGTHDGLARYDGVAFRVYRYDPKDRGSLAGNVASALFVDRDNRVWCGTEESGLNELDAHRGRFAHYRHDDKDGASLSSDDVWSIAQDKAGAIWVGTYAGGLDKLEPGARSFVHHRFDAGDAKTISSDIVIGLFAASDGRLWVGTDAGIDVIATDGSIRRVDVSTLPGGGRINAYSMTEVAGGAVLASTRRGLVRIDPALSASVVAGEGLSDRIVFGAVPGSDTGELWIATRHGLNRRTSAGTLTAYLQNTALPGAFPGDTVNDVMRDREGSLWFATGDSGVAILPASWRNFALFRNDPATTSSLSANRTQGLTMAADGALWVVNIDGGIDRLDPATGRVERMAGRLTVPEKTLWSVLQDHSGQLWVGHSHGLRVYDLQSGQFYDLPVDGERRDALAPGLVDHIVEDPAGPVWVSTFDVNGGIHRIDPASHRIERFDASNAGLRNAEVDQIGFDPQGNLLAASGAGLDRFDPANRHFVAVAGTPGQRVYAFAFAADGSLWLHRLGALEHYRVEALALTLLDRVDGDGGWPALTAGGLQVDAAGAIWVSSTRGLWRYQPTTRAIRLFDHRDGLANSEFNRLPLVRRADGAIFGGTLAGVVGFRPDRIVEPMAPPPLVIDSVVLRRDGRDEAIDPTIAELALRWSDRDLRITARALGYINPSANRYQWQLAGFDNGWIDTGNRGEREFSQLRPGNYLLRLRASAAASAWSAAIEPLRLHVGAPPWATPAAYAGYAVLVILVLLSVFRGSRRYARRRHKYELVQQQRRYAEQSSAAKTEFLATMGHEIRTPMTGVLGMAELLLRTPLDATQRGYAQTIQNSGRMMLRLVNDSLDLARIEAGKVDLDEAPFDLQALIGEIGAVAEPLALAKGLQWAAHVADDAPRWLRGDAVRIKQVLLNLVNNAIKFTESGSVALDARRAPGAGVEFAICDSGPGIAESTRARLFQRFEQADGAQRHGGSGLGLAICRELVARMGGSITLDSEAGRGSTFRVHLPLPEAAADAAAVPAGQATAQSAADVQAAVPRRILLVEDDATVAAVITAQLLLQGHQVVHAAQGLAALGECDRAQFDLALIDLDLPGVDGLALARLLRTRETQSGTTRLPLIGISARSTGNEEALCLAAGMDAFLRKPLTGEVLAAQLAAVNQCK
ncbi:MAG TPA: two-component regulator propeller domain-containing protein [Rudaea sp.]|jgi:signal transduction histidine kinase/streptogramin lyase/ActR/RegA family two-component response regulator